MAEDKYLNERKHEELAEDLRFSSSFLSNIAAGIGVIGLGTAIFTRTGRGLLADSLHYMGHPSGAGLRRSLDKLARTVKKTGTQDTGARSFFSSTYDVNKAEPRLAPLDLIDDMRNSLEILGTSSPAIREEFVSATSEYVHREHASRGLYSSFFGNDLQRLTVKEVLNDQRRFADIVGRNEWKVLKRSAEEGLLGTELDKLYLDKSLFKARTGELRDLRLKAPFHHDPVTKEGGIFGKVFGGLDFFGQASVVKSFIGSRRGVAVLPTQQVDVTQTLGPGETRTVKESIHRFFIGGDVFAFTKEGRVKLQSNQVLREMSDPMHAVVAARRGDSVKSRRKILETYRGTGLHRSVQKALTRAELSMGVGKGFATRPSLMQRLIINPMRRYKAIKSGAGTVYRHKFRYAKRGTKAADAFFGDVYPEIASARGEIIPVSHPSAGKATKWQDLSARERFGTLFDFEDELSVVQTRSLLRKQKNELKLLTNRDLVVPMPEAGLGYKDQRAPSRYRGTRFGTSILTKAGEKVESSKASYYASRSSSLSKNIGSVRDLTNYLVYRINNLASDSLLGIGFSPGRNAFESSLKLATIPLIYEGGRQLFNWMDYKTEDLTGFSPKKAAADIYVSANLGLHKIRESLGIQQVLQSAEENFPGIVSSEGSALARNIVAPLSFLLSKSQSMGGPIGKAAGAFALIGGLRPDQPSEELREEYMGERKVPVRRGAFWGLGYNPFFGGSPKYYDYSWYHKLKTDSNVVGTYGSKEEYYKYHQNIFGIPMPTPDTWFGLRQVLEPYRFETKNWESRPYPITSSQLEEFPIYGPLLASTIGQITKPTKYRKEEHLPLVRANLVERGLQPSTAQDLGIPPINASSVQIEDPYDPVARMRKMADIAAEPLGLYKFVMEFFGMDLGPSGRPRLASSDIPVSTGRSLYSAGMGGMFSQTEFIRRFMLSEYSSSYNIKNLYNPIPNTSPEWLPGSRSMFERDRRYFLDFSRGDPYTKVERGETRLPGRGYEVLNPLHSEEGGEYSVVDRFLILADVAPYSSAYREYLGIVLRMNLPPEWQEKVDRAIEQRRKVVGVDDRYLRGEQETLRKLATPEEETSRLNEFIKERAIYNTARSAYDTVTHDILAEIPYLGSKIFPFRDPYEQYRKLQVEGSEYADWNRPFEAIIRPAYYDIALEDPATAAMKGAGLGALASGPLQFFMPFTKMHATGGMGLGPYSFNPLAIGIGATVGSVISTSRILSGEDETMIPQHKQKEAAFLDYADRLKYLKARTYEERAKAEGKPDVASQFRRVQTSTMIGANNPIMLKSSLPTSSDRKFFEYFTNTAPYMQEQILGGMPGYMRAALTTAKSRDYPSQQEADQQIASYFSNMPVPSFNQVDWHPSVPSDVSTLRMINHGVGGISDNFHRYGFYDTHVNELKYRFPDINQAGIEFNVLDNFSNISEMTQAIGQEVDVTTSFTSPYGHTANYMNRKSRFDLDQYYEYMIP